MLNVYMNSWEMHSLPIHLQEMDTKLEQESFKKLFEKVVSGRTSRRDAVTFLKNSPLKDRFTLKSVLKEWTEHLQKDGTPTHSESVLRPEIIPIISKWVCTAKNNDVALIRRFLTHLNNQKEVRNLTTQMAEASAPRSARSAQSSVSQQKSAQQKKPKSARSTARSATSRDKPNNKEPIATRKSARSVVSARNNKKPPPVSARADEIRLMPKNRVTSARPSYEEKSSIFQKSKSSMRAKSSYSDRRPLAEITFRDSARFHGPPVNNGSVFGQVVSVRQPNLVDSRQRESKSARPGLRFSSHSYAGENEDENAVDNKQKVNRAKSAGFVNSVRFESTENSGSVFGSARIITPTNYYTPTIAHHKNMFLPPHNKGQAGAINEELLSTNRPVAHHMKNYHPSEGQQSAREVPQGEEGSFTNRPVAHHKKMYHPSSQDTSEQKNDQQEISSSRTVAHHKKMYHPTPRADDTNAGGETTTPGAPQNHKTEPALDSIYTSRLHHNKTRFEWDATPRQHVVERVSSATIAHHKRQFMPVTISVDA